MGKYNSKTLYINIWAPRCFALLVTMIKLFFCGHNNFFFSKNNFFINFTSRYFISLVFFNILNLLCKMPIMKFLFIREIHK
jgi:hypothetical protein